MSNRIDGLGEIGASVQRALLERAGRVTARLQERRGLESDLLESDDEYLVVFDAPGAVSTDVQVRYVEGSVRVRLDRFRDYHEGFEMRFPGRGLSLDGRVDLPDDAVVDPDAADATLTDHGTLEVVLPKRED
ncbi:molecular chaperone Hsp20, partial [Halobacteriales archaeon SW_12_71_31]